MNVLSSILNWITENLNGFIIGVLSGLAITGVGRFIKYLKNRSSFNTGWWEQVIYDKDSPYQGDPIKVDYYRLKHTKTKYSGSLVINVEGIIRRKYSIYEKRRRSWIVRGYLADDVFTLLYRAHEGQKSRGCIYVKMKHNGDYQGYYLEEHEDQDGNEIIDKTPLIIKKVLDENKIRELSKWWEEQKQEDVKDKRNSRIK